jgi:hypothetical protein
MSLVHSSGTQVCTKLEAISRGESKKTCTHEARFMLGVPSMSSACSLYCTRCIGRTKLELVVQDLVSNFAVDPLVGHLEPRELLVDIVSGGIWDVVQVLSVAYQLVGPIRAEQGSPKSWALGRASTFATNVGMVMD